MESADVVVIGSGYGGAIPAARLAEAGMKVVVLERGEKRVASAFEQSDDPKYINRVLDFFVSSGNVAYRTGKLVGGASMNMDGGCFRLPAQGFSLAEGDRRVWPEVYTRASLDPYYERAEAMLKVRQRTWAEIPKAGGLFAKLLDDYGASAELARMNYLNCTNCGFCTQGCKFGKKITMLESYLTLAERRGAEVRASTEVDHLEPEGTGYRVFWRRGAETGSIVGQRVFVAGGGIYTPALLLKSRPHLPRLSSQVGLHFNNNGEHAYIGVLPPEFEDLDAYQCWKGMDNSGIMSFHWYASEGFTLHPGGGFEPAVLAATLERADHPIVPRKNFGLAFKRFMKAVYPHRLIGFSSLGLSPSHAAITLRPNGRPDVVERDRTGVDRYLDRLDAIIEDLEAKTGVTLIPTVPRKLYGMTSAHLLSGARMAESAEHGVVSPDGEVFGHENLYVADASAIPGSLGVNPALTISAIAERVSERVIAKG